MADNNNKTPTVDATYLDSVIKTMSSMQMSQQDVLRSIDKSLKEISKDANNPFPLNGSQSAYSDRVNASRDSRNARNRNRFVRNDYDDEVDFRWDAKKMRRRGQHLEDQVDDFFDEFERQMFQTLAGDPITKVLGESLRAFADSIGSSVEDLGKDLGKKLGERAANSFKESDFGDRISKELTNGKNKFVQRINDGLAHASDSFNEGGGLSDMLRSFRDGAGLPKNFKELGDVAQNVGGDLLKIGQNGGRIFQAFQGAFTHGGGLLGGMEAAATSISRLGLTALSGTEGLLTLGGALGVAGAAVVGFQLIIKAGQAIMNKFKEAVQPAIDSAKKFGEAIKNAANRDQDMAARRLDAYRERIKKDNESYIRAPYEILKKSAEEVYEAWDRIVTLVGQTQGYDKEGIQDLWSNYAKRLQEEGLSSVVSSVDIMGGLEKVLQAGMSGPVAEEFAYIATKLSNAIPTEDFFDYASTYASVAANAIKNGKSQSEAIAEANEQLEEFASNLLYSSRELAGGFSTGLTHAEGLFEAANNIAVAAHTENQGEISGVLTSVAAIVGAIAPDLTQSIVTKITDAATGGNSPELVALRSLAGTGASNTAFLRAMAEDPQSVFIKMFSNLAQMQNMYGDNYMEVAEGLSKTFGLSMDEMSRIDFGYLAQAVSAMDLNNASLNENIALLASGNTTLTADQLRMQQINQYMIDEGLSYVLDNEVARAIQEHMWEEQIAQELMENTYSTELTGAGLEFLQGLQFSVDNIFTMLNPFGWMKKVESLVAVAGEGIALNKDIAAMLEKGNLGKSNPATLYKLTHGNQNLNLTKKYIELLGGVSKQGIVQTAHTITGTLFGNKYARKNASDALKGFVRDTIMSSRQAPVSPVTSQYRWSTIGKSITRDVFTTGNRALYNSGDAYPELNMGRAQDIISQRAAQNMQRFLDTMQSFVDEGKSYEEWKASASEYGIEDVGAALQDYELNETQAKGKFQEMEAVKAAMYEHERDLKEEQFWEDVIKWCEEDFPNYVDQVYLYYDDIIAHEDTLITNTELIIGELQESNRQLKEFYRQWVEYFVNHTAYHRDTLNAHEIEAIKSAEVGETGDAVFALAQALTDNLVNLQDPQVQTNAILSQILLVTEAIFQIENNTTTVSLPTALSSLGLGVTSVENQY